MGKSLKNSAPALKGEESQTKKPLRGKRDRSLTEAKLIKAGTLVFSKYGYDAATTKLISSKSGVNESLIMRYFGGKEGLLLEILRRYLDQRRATPLPYPPQESLVQELLQYIRQGSESSRKDSEVLRIMLLRASVDPGIRKKVLAMLPLEGDPKLIERVDLLKAKGKIPKNLNPKLLSLIGFQNFSAAFISDLLFDEKMQAEIRMDLETLVLHTLTGLLGKDASGIGAP